MNAFGSAMARVPPIYDGESVARRGPRRELRLTVQYFAILARNDDVEAPHRPIPVIELALGASAAGEPRVLLDQAADQVALAKIGDVHQVHQPRVALTLQLTELVEDERESAAHSR